MTHSTQLTRAIRTLIDMDLFTQQLAQYATIGPCTHMCPRKALMPTKSQRPYDMPCSRTYTLGHPVVLDQRPMWMTTRRSKAPTDMQYTELLTQYAEVRP